MILLFEKSNKLDSTNFDYYARYSYERFLFSQPHIYVKGLYYDKKSSYYYVLCPDIDGNTKAMDGSNIFQWFANNKVAGWPIKLVNNIPSNALEVEERNIEELINGSGTPDNLRNTIIKLYLMLPKDFPFIYLRYNKDQEIEIVVDKQLTKEENSLLKNIIKKLGIPLNYRLLVDSKVKEKAKFRVFNQGDIEIIPSKFVSDKYSKNLRTLLEDDEYFWVENRESILKGKIKNQTGILPNSWDRLQSRCFLDATVFPQENIRNFLPMYENIIIALPINGYDDNFLFSLKIDLNDLIDLANIGRVSFVLPQSIDRYSLNMIEPLVEAVPDSFILTRRLAALSIIDSRIRFPFLYLPFGIKERTYLLRVLYSSVSYIKNDNIRKILEGFICELGRIWSIEEEMVNLRGSMAIGSIGMGSIASSILKSIHGIDRLIEFFSADRLVGLAAPFSANVVPQKFEENYVQILSNIYSGLRTGEYPYFIKNSSVILNGLLTINSDAPVMDLAKSFKGKDIERLRKIICKISDETVNIDEINEIICKFNKEIINYENRKTRLSKINIIGLICIISELSGKIRGISLVKWLLEILYNHRNDNDIIGVICDYIESIITCTKPKIVFVSRLRDKLS